MDALGSWLRRVDELLTRYGSMESLEGETAVNGRFYVLTQLRWYMNNIPESIFNNSFVGERVQAVGELE